VLVSLRGNPPARNRHDDTGSGCIPSRPSEIAVIRTRIGIERFRITRTLVLSSFFIAGLLITGATKLAATSGTFAFTGSLNTPRYYHTATLLLSGEVLVTGGTDVNDNPLASSELYNPATGTWSATGSMAASRGQGFTATLLPNGEVLVAGGYYNGTCLATAELYNSSTGEWTATGSMSQPRCYHSAALLPNGDLLVAGGTNSAGTAGTSAELYNPSTGKWQTTGNLNTSRENGAATLLANEVLLAGGENFKNGVETILTTAELYNPSSGVWSVTGSMITGIYSPASALLGNNDVLIANAAQFYSPTTASWAKTGPLPRTAENPLRATLLPNGNVLASGTNCSYSGCGHVPTATCFLYTTSTNSWSVTGKLNQPRIDHTSTLLLNGKVLIAGGLDRGLGTGITILGSAELYTP
jgi:Galactose oxidase, central domain/Kelch motif